MRMLLSCIKNCYHDHAGRERSLRPEFMTMNNAFMNISTVLAEDAGAPELRNPLAGGMRAKGLLSRLFGRKDRVR